MKPLRAPGASARRYSRAQLGFSVIEILLSLTMTVVILSMAVPSLSRTRGRSDALTCVSNLVRIDSARRQWALDNRKSDSVVVTISTDLINASRYLASVPVCPNGGRYVAGTVNTPITCSMGTQDDNDPGNDHVLP